MNLENNYQLPQLNEDYKLSAEQVAVYQRDGVTVQL
jgi:hypothetical protein